VRIVETWGRRAVPRSRRAPDRAWPAPRFHEAPRAPAHGGALRRWVDPAGRVGLSAQGLVLALVGVYLLVAAVKRSPGEATGFDGALASVARQPFGTALLGAVAIGLLGYAIFSAIEGAYRRFGR
jgi:hypothetical protein